MYIYEVWKKLKSFKKDLEVADFQQVLHTLSYRQLANKSVTNKEGAITRRKFLVINPSGRIETIVLGKTYNIISITSK